MEVSDLQYYEKFKDLEKRVEVLESYHEIQEIKLSYDRYEDKAYGSSGGKWNGETVNTTGYIYYMLYQIIPEGISEEDLILEKEGEYENRLVVELIPATHEIKIRIARPFSSIVTINLYSPNRKVKGSLTIEGRSGTWLPE